mgnify:FL=1
MHMTNNFVWVLSGCTSDGQVSFEGVWDVEPTQEEVEQFVHETYEADLNECQWDVVRHNVMTIPTYLKYDGRPVEALEVRF